MLSALRSTDLQLGPFHALQFGLVALDERIFAIDRVVGYLNILSRRCLDIVGTPEVAQGCFGLGCRPSKIRPAPQLGSRGVAAFGKSVQQPVIGGLG